MLYQDGIDVVFTGDGGQEMIFKGSAAVSATDG